MANSIDKCHTGKHNGCLFFVQSIWQLQVGSYCCVIVPGPAVSCKYNISFRLSSSAAACTRHLSAPAPAPSTDAQVFGIPTCAKAGSSALHHCSIVFDASVYGNTVHAASATFSLKSKIHHNCHMASAGDHIPTGRQGNCRNLFPPRKPPPQSPELRGHLLSEQ